MPEEVTRVLPPGEEQPVDCSEVAELARAAIRRTLRDLEAVPVPERIGGRIRDISESESKWEELSVPDYRAPVVWKRIDQVWASPETIALTEYLWDCGRLKKTLSGEDPDKRGWARFVYADLVHQPLLVALEKTLSEDLIDVGPIMAWKLDPEVLEECVRDAVSLHCAHDQRVTAHCPLVGITLPAEGSFQITPEVRLRQLSKRDSRLFMARWRHEFLWDDFKTPFIRTTLAEVHFSIGFGKGVSHASVVRRVQDHLDLLKWGLFVALGRDQPICEGTCVLQGRLDGRMGRFRRDDNLGPADASIDQGTLDYCVDLIRNFHSCLASTEDIGRALWHFGRSCVVSLPRDVLLESAIGIDSLVGRPGGDSRYRFSLHGAAVLARDATEGVELFKKLQEIYDKRSGGAHGGAPSEMEQLALRARLLLAKMIDRITILVQRREIDLSNGVASGVARWVVERATAGR